MVLKLPFDMMLVEKAIGAAFAAQGIAKFAFVLIVDANEQKCVSSNIVDNARAVSMTIEAAMVMDMSKAFEDDDEVVGHA